MKRLSPEEATIVLSLKEAKILYDKERYLSVFKLLFIKSKEEFVTTPKIYNSYFGKLWKLLYESYID